VCIAFMPQKRQVLVIRPIPFQHMLCISTNAAHLCESCMRSPLCWRKGQHRLLALSHRLVPLSPRKTRYLAVSTLISALMDARIALPQMQKTAEQTNQTCGCVGPGTISIPNHGQQQTAASTALYMWPALAEP
jgi:hypothetical protein